MHFRSPFWRATTATHWRPITRREELGLAVGRDIFIAGFDDIPKAAELEPPLTTVHQPRREIGLEAAQLLHKLMRRELRGPVTVTLPVTLVGRDSD